MRWAQRLGARESGFGAAWHDHEVPKRELLAQASADDLADFGLLPEFIGRLPVVSVLEELTENNLVRILVEPENALVKQYQKLFAIDGVTLTFTEGAVRQIAATSIRRGTGARGLRSIIEKTLEDTMFQLPSMTGVSEVAVSYTHLDRSAHRIRRSCNHRCSNPCHPRPKSHMPAPNNLPDAGSLTACPT